MGGKLILFWILFVSQSKYNQLVNSINPLKDDKGSLVFVFDTTGSMFNDLKQLREGAEMILKTALEESNIGDFVFVPFHDPAVGPATVTTQKEVFKSVLNIVRVYGGGDCPEKSLGGIQLALNVSRPRSFVFVFTDATASDHKLVNKVLENIQRKQSQVVFVLTGHCNDVDRPSYKVYQQIAAASSGQVFNLNKTSVYKVLEFVRSSIKGRTVNLLSAINPAGYNYTQKIPVDKTVDEVTVSVSGSNPRIHLVSPSGKELTGPPQLVTILDLSEIMIVSVLSPEAGEWGVRAGSSAPHSVRVRARSEVDVTHGFSVARVTDLKETSNRPLKGTYNNMLISLSANESVKLHHAELLDLNGKLLFEVPLKEVDAANNVYIAEAFIPPEEFFNIAVVGVDSSGQTVRRAGRTAVSATDPDVPYLLVPKKVVANAHSRVVLRCVVESLVPVRAGWTRRGKDLHAHTHSLQSTTVEHVIEDMTEGNVGMYRCTASNAAGRATADTGLDMIVPPPQVSLCAGAAAERQRVVLRCSVYSEAYVQRARIDFEGKTRRYATDFHLEPSIDGFYNFNITIESASEADTGVYTCFAVNRGGVSNQTINLDVLLNPTATILGPHTLTKLIHSHMQLVCLVDNTKQMLWIYNDNIVERNDVNGSYNAMLNVDNVKEDGTWTCTAIMGVYNASDSVYVTVQIKPQVTIIGAKNISLPQDSTYNVTCSVVARPQPRVLWHRETEEFLYHVLTNPEPNVYTSVLTVNGTAGTYFCFGENTEGIDQDSVVVNIYTPMVIVEGLTDTSVELYSPVKLHCNISASPLPTIKWYHNNTRIQINKNEDNNKTSVLIEDNVLIINRAKFDNIGNYSCEADNGYEKMILNCTLSVQGLVPPPQVSLCAGAAAERQRVVLRCSVYSEAYVQRARIDFEGKTRRNATDFHLEPSIDGFYNFNITIESASEADTGVYTCFAVNRGGVSNQTINLDVLLNPTATILGPHTLTKLIHSHMQLVCHVDNAKQMLWIYNDNIVERNDVNGSYNAMLNVDNVKEDGTWTCKAIMGVYNASDSVHVTVQIKPQVTIIGAKNISLPQDSTYNVTCSVVARPQPRVLWHRETEEYLYHVLTNPEPNVYTSVLTVNGTAGTYFCFGENTEGIDQDSVVVNMYTPMVIVEGLSDTAVELYSPVKLNCNISASPLPTIKWYHNNTRIQTNKNKDINETSVLIEENVLIINRAKFDDIGNYSCEANNGYEKMILNCTLSVHGLVPPPQVSLCAGAAAERQRVVLRCSVYSEAYVQRARIDFEGKTRRYATDFHLEPSIDGFYNFNITIESASEADTGVYTCFAVNRGGVSNQTINLDVLLNPTATILGPHTLTKLIHSHMQLVCLVDNAKQMLWIYNDNIVERNDVNGSYNAMLNVDNVKEDGTWTCKAIKGVYNASDSVHVTVQIKPQVTIIGAKNISLPQDSTYNVTCSVVARPQPRVLWHRETEEFLYHVLTNPEPNVYTSVLTVNGTGGTYFCFGENTEGIDQDSVVVNIYTPMVIVEGLTDTSVELYSPVKLHCNISASPLPTIKWYHNNTRIQTNKNENINETSVLIEDNVLIINRAKFDNIGNYSCEADNGYEKMILNCTLSVQGLVPPPQVSLCAGAAAERQRVVLRCSVYSEAYVQRARIDFEGKTRRYATDFHLEPSIDGFYNFNITIESASEADTGVYTCFAVNRGGVSNQTINLDVLLNPTATILGPHTLTKLIHSHMQLVCHVDNAKQMLWIYNDNIVERNDVNGSYNAMLNVDNVKEDGTWTCTAIMGVYNASDSVHVTVQIKPQVTIIGAKNISLPQDSTYNVTCSVVARPQPRVLWHRETEEFLYHVLTNPEPNVYTSVLTVNGTGGTYFCFGENTEGIDQDSVVVNIYTPMVIVEGLSDTSVELYSPVKLHCNISASPLPTIKWYHNNTRIQTIKNEDINETSLIEDNVLIINKVNFNDLGDYFCEADNGYEKKILHCSLSVHGLAIPMIYKGPVKIVVHKGKSLNLTCRILSGNPKPDITWGYIQNSNLTTLPHAMVKEDSVIIHKVVKENAGNYRCEASNVIGRDVYEVNVVVQYPPELNLTQEAYKEEGAMQVKSGEKIRLYCNVTGDPIPVVTWTKNGSPVTYSINLYLRNESLLIENATKFDSGVYACNASNILGAILKNFTIIVYTSPKISNNNNTEIQVLEGQLVELPCLVSGLPEPGIRWTHNGQDIIDMRRHRDEYGLRFVANLTDFGEYECIASNEFGNASLNYTLYIWVAPSIDSPLEEVINIKKGLNVSFECDAVGFPVPTISWEFNKAILSENTTSVSFNDRGYLSITNASVLVAGAFTCIAENIAGTAVKNYVVLVNEPPHLLRDDYSGVYVASTLDRELAISCLSAGDPPPYVYWSKDGVGLQSDARYAIDPDGTLSIKSPTEQAAGVYSCTARNTAGSDSKDVHVQIYSPPTLLQEEGSPLITSVVEGRDLRVSCPVRGNVTVKWYKDAIHISNGTLNFSNISRTNASTYACVASNVIGSVQINVAIDVQWPPKLQDGGDVEILAGNDYFFNCTTDAKPQAEIKWLFNSKTLIGENKEKLSILDAKVYNSGIYRCVASNSHGTAFKDTQLHVLERPFLSNFNKLEVELKAGTNATLECNATGSPRPNITWTYNNTDWELQDTSLVSYNVTSLSEGVFVCKASSRAGSRSLVYRVVVVAEALVEEVVIFVDGAGRGVEGSVEIAVGTNARIACKASGKPGPIIQWLHNGNSVSNNTGLYTDLTFKNVTVSNKGLYVCVASNIAGVDQRRVKVDVLEPPRIFQTLYHNANSSQNTVRLEVISDQVFYLHCHPNGNPIPDIYWFKDGVPLKFYNDDMVSTDFGEIITSKSAKYEQSGNYTCVARNKLDNTSVSYLVDVLVPPPPQKGDIKQVSTISGSPLNLTCPVDGRPPPVVTWIKHPYTDLVDTPRTRLLNYNYTLFFTKTETSDSGKYSCIITNSVGTTELVYDVMVQTLPTIAGNDSQLIVSLGRSIVLKCNVDGVPEPKVTWFKDIQPLTPTSASVHQAWHTHVAHVMSARVIHAGEYRCVAENTAGVTQRRYSVTVQVPGKWSTWSPWGYCNVTCGLGYQQRERRCQYIDDNNNIIDKDNEPVNILIDESSCKGLATNRRKCNMPSCEERPSVAWSAWSVWSVCSSSCGAGSQMRARACRGGRQCVGDDLQIRKCIDLPKCEYGRKQNTVREDINKNNINPDYIPEATFEMEPESMNLEKPTPSYTDENYILAQSPPLYEVKVTQNLDHSEQGPCDPGSRYITKTDSCEDIDECVSVHSCHSTQTCVNTERGYACSCSPGYRSLGAGQRCMDVNECTQDLHGCEFACVNTAGGYVCACPSPLRLHADRRHCFAPSMQHGSDDYDEDYLGTNIL